MQGKKGSEVPAEGGTDASVVNASHKGGRPKSCHRRSKLQGWGKARKGRAVFPILRGAVSRSSQAESRGETDRSSDARRKRPHQKRGYSPIVGGGSRDRYCPQKGALRTKGKSRVI